MPADKRANLDQELLRHLEEPGDSAALGLLNTIMNRRIADHIRDSASERTRLQASGTAPPAGLGAIEDKRTVSPASLASRRELFRRIGGLIDQLPAREKRIIKLHFERSMSVREVAAEVQLPVSTTGAIIFRTLGAIRRTLRR